MTAKKVSIFNLVSKKANMDQYAAAAAEVPSNDGKQEIQR
jgi:hypothetical protein